jgi:hypothetical protein
MHMLASLDHYPPTCDPATGWSTRARRS